ncbi:putative secreted protein [Actinomycetales bacterium JB111]|nr:putative secreted protein [Actinomycetales bacterium JB111]
MQPFTLTDGRVRIDPLTDADVDDVALACQDPEIAEWTTVPVPYDRGLAESYVATSTDPAEWAAGRPCWAVREDGDGRLQGVIGLRLVEGAGGPAAVGYWTAPWGRGRGLTSAALGLAADAAFDRFRAGSVVWECEIHDDVVNWDSWRVAWRVGFRRDAGVTRAAHFNKGALHDGLRAVLLPGDPREPAAAWDGPARGGETPARGEASSSGTAPAPDPRDPDALVRQFHATYDLPVVTGGPADADIDRVHMRTGLVVEEAAELVGAVYGERAEEILIEAFARAVAADDGTRDTVEVADALGDLVYVAYGMALECGIPLPEVLGEIQASNMSKLGADGRPIYREDGKVLKGPGFFPPDIAGVLGRVRLAD